MHFDTEIHASNPINPGWPRSVVPTEHRLKPNYRPFIAIELILLAFVLVILFLTR